VFSKIVPYKSTKSKETFVLGANYDQSSRRGGQNRETVSIVWHGLFRARGQRLLVRAFASGIAMDPGTADGLWVMSIRVDGVCHVDGLEKARSHASCILYKIVFKFSLLCRKFIIIIS